MRLGRIGFDNVAGYLDGGMRALDARPDLVGRTERITAPNLAALVVYCASGYRAAIAASVLLREGWVQSPTLSAGSRRWESSAGDDVLADSAAVGLATAAEPEFGPSQPGGESWPSAGLFIGWGDAITGREKKGLEVFAEALAYYGKAEQDGRIESHETVLLDPHGGDLAGFVLRPWQPGTSSTRCAPRTSSSGSPRVPR